MNGSVYTAFIGVDTRMANRIILKRSHVAGKIPTVSQLEYGELAVNTRDGKVYLKRDDGSGAEIISLDVGSGGSGGGIDSSQLDLKVDKVQGKGLSTHDFDEYYKGRIDSFNSTIPALQTQVNSATSATITLQNALSDESAARIIAVADAIQTAAAYTDSNVTTERNARIDNDTTVLNSAKSYSDQNDQLILSQAQTYTDTAIADVDDRIDTIFSNTTTLALDSLTEIVSAFQTADNTLNGAITTLASGAEAAIEAEADARIAADEATLNSAKAYADSVASSGGMDLTAISAGTGINYDNQTGVISIGSIDTSFVPETSNIQYFLPSRARAALSAGTGISYDDQTGVISSTVIGYTDELARNAISATTNYPPLTMIGGISYDNTTGVITYNAPSDSDIRGLFSAGTGISFSSGVIENTDLGSSQNIFKNFIDNASTFATANSNDDTFKFRGADGVTATIGNDGVHGKNLLIGLSSVPNSSLANSSITINGANIQLGGSGSISTSEINEGTNLYYTDGRVASLLSSFGSNTISTTGSISGGAVSGTGLNVTGYSSFFASQDKISVLTGSTGTVTHNTLNGSVFYHTSPVANFTPNFTNVPTTDNYATVMVLFVVQGSTPYIPTSAQINGSAVAILWAGGAAPTGTASQTNMFSFSLMRVSGAWTILATTASYA